MTTVTAVLQCAGNRRADLQLVRPTSGDPWAPGAIGNAAWTGVSLADVLRAAGAETDAASHVAFDACDEVDMPKQGRFTYGASIPIAKAMSPEVLLAYAMNGEPLTPEHGFPLRVVVPGFAGVRSPKWLTAITVQDSPSGNHMQQRDYKLVPPDVTGETVDWEAGMTIYDMPLNSAICEPAAPRCAVMPSRPPATSCGWTSRSMVAAPGNRRSWSTTRTHPGAGRFGPPRWTCRKASMSWQCGPGTPPGRPSRRSRTTPGISRGT